MVLRKSGYRRTKVSVALKFITAWGDVLMLSFVPI